MPIKKIMTSQEFPDNKESKGKPGKV